MSDYAYAQIGGTFGYLLCCRCGEILRKDYRSNHASMKPTNFCPNCGERIGKQRKLRDGELTELMEMQVARNEGNFGVEVKAVDNERGYADIGLFA